VESIGRGDRTGKVSVLDGSNPEGVRTLHELTKRLERYDFDGGCLFTDANRGMLFEHTVGKRRRDGEIVESWYRAGQ